MRRTVERKDKRRGVKNRRVEFIFIRIQFIFVGEMTPISHFLLLLTCRTRRGKRRNERLVRINESEKRCC